MANVPMLNAINWTAGIDQIEKGDEQRYRSAALLANVTGQQAASNRQDTQQGMSTLMTGLQFYANYDQKQDEAKRSQARLSMDTESHKQTVAFNEQRNPLLIEQAKNVAEEQRAQILQKGQEFKDTQDAKTRDADVRNTSRQAFIEDFKKKNGGKLPPNWEQMTADGQYGYAAGTEETRSKTLAERKATADAVTAEGGAALATEKGKNAKKIVAGELAQTRAQTGLALASTERTKIETTKEAFELGQKAAVQGQQDLALRSNGTSLFTPMTPEQKAMAETEGKRTEPALKEMEAFADLKETNDEIKGILFNGQKPMNPDGSYSDKQVADALESLNSGGKLNTPDGQRLKSLLAKNVMSNKAAGGGGALSESDVSRMEQVTGNPSAMADGEFFDITKRFYADAKTRSYLTTTSQQEEKARANIASKLGDPSFVDPQRLDGNMQRMAGYQSKPDEWKKLSLDEKSRLSFGSTDSRQVGSDGRIEATPRWNPGEANRQKWQMYNDIQNGEGHKYRTPAREVQNPFEGSGNSTAERAFNAGQKINALSYAPPRHDVPMTAPNGTTIAPQQRGAYLTTPDLNRNYAPVSSWSSGAPALATPRPKNQDEYFKSNGYNSNAMKQSVQGAFK